MVEAIERVKEAAVNVVVKAVNGAKVLASIKVKSQIQSYVEVKVPKDIGQLEEEKQLKGPGFVGATIDILGSVSP